VSHVHINSKSDLLGISASVLCMIHCLATPFLFVAHAEMVQHSEAHPEWWEYLEIFFLVISFMAVWWSGKTTSKKWVRNLLWINWVILAFFVVNEKFSWVAIADALIYIPAIGLVILHFYNRKFFHSHEEKLLTEKT